MSPHKKRGSPATLETGDPLKAKPSAHQPTTNGTEPPGTEPPGEFAAYNPFVDDEAVAAKRVVDRYDYEDRDGGPLFQVRRWEPKKFTQHAYLGNGRWAKNLNGVRPVLYRLPQVLAARSAGKTVWVAEGEKDVHALEAAGVVATCNPAGAGMWKPEFGFAEALLGTEIIIVADKDDAGRKHARTIYEEIKDSAPFHSGARDTTVSVVEAKVGKDAADHLAAGLGLEDFVPVDPATLPRPAEKKAREQASSTEGTVPAVVQLILMKLAEVFDQRGIPGGPSPVVGKVNEWESLCPAHEDSRPSLRIGVGTKHPAVVRCFAGCTAEEVATALGINPQDLMTPNGIPPNSGSSATEHLRIWTAKELAEIELGPPEWVVKHLLIKDTFGPVAGDKKTLKTYLMGLLNVAIAKGGKFLGAFPVPQAGPVVSFIGEGGRDPHLMRLHRICAAMNVKLGDLPLVQVYETASLSSSLFRNTLDLALAEHEPIHTSIDPLYAYHPTEIDTKNLYQRGPMLAHLSSACVDAGSTLLTPDHFNKSGSGNGLDRISMAGVAEWADTWMLVTHRKPPDVSGGNFWLTIEVGSRQWGGHKFDVDLSIGAFDADLMQHDGRITFSARPHVPVEKVGNAKTEARIIEVLNDHPYEFTKTELRTDKVKGNSDVFEKAFDRLVNDGIIACQPVPKPRKDGKVVTQHRWARR